MALQQRGIPVIAIPASIDNDIPFTDMSLGVDSALNNILHAVDCLKDTASSHDRTFVVETMGRSCGYLALASAVATGAEYALVPEVPFDIDAISAALQRRFQEGRDNSIIMVAEGAGKAQDIADQIKDRIGFETRIMVLGHYQRGGSPSTFDRILGRPFRRGSGGSPVARRIRQDDRPGLRQPDTDQPRADHRHRPQAPRPGAAQTGKDVGELTADPSDTGRGSVENIRQTNGHGNPVLESACAIGQHEQPLQRH